MTNGGKGAKPISNSPPLLSKKKTDLFPFRTLFRPSIIFSWARNSPPRATCYAWLYSSIFLAATYKARASTSGGEAFVQLGRMKAKHDIY